MHVISESIEIAAPAAKVWSIITDLSSYHQWNSFVVYAESDSATLAPGVKTTINIKPLPTSSQATYKNTITVVTPGKELRWTGSLVHEVIFNTEHWCLIEEINSNRCRLTQGEKFTGILVPVVKLTKTFNELQQGYERMNNDLRTFAEQESTTAA